MDFVSLLSMPLPTSLPPCPLQFVRIGPGERQPVNPQRRNESQSVDKPCSCIVANINIPLLLLPIVPADRLLYLAQRVCKGEGWGERGCQICFKRQTLDLCCRTWLLVYKSPHRDQPHFCHKGINTHPLCVRINFQSDLEGFPWTK